MKNSLFRQNNFDNDTLLSAVKKAKERAGILNSGAEQSILGNLTAQSNTAGSKITSQSKIDQVEDRLDYDNRWFSPTNRQVSTGSVPPGRTINGDDGQKKEDEDYAERKEQERAREALERMLRHDLFGEPLVDKPDPRDKGELPLEDTWKAPLYSGGALVKNGARTRGYTDTATGSAPVRFWAGTDKDKQRIQKEAVARGVETNQEFHDYLVGAHIDIFNATPEQKEIIDMVAKELMKKAVNDTLTEEDKARIFQNASEYLYKRTKSANGDPYPVFIDIARSYDNSGGVFPEQRAMKDSTMSDADLKLIFEFGRQTSSNKDQNEINENRQEYKNQIFLEEMENYKEALQKGKAKVGDIQKYYDTALQRIYDTCIMPIPVKDNKGKAAGTVAIGDLIAPYDDSFGAEVVRTAMQLVGLKYEYPAGKGKYYKMEIDCSRLVNWAVAQLNENWGINGISKNAGYQMAAIENSIWNRDEDGSIIRYTDLKIGDTLFWKGDETGEIKHTAIYIGMNEQGIPLMIEAGPSVQIVPVRWHTTNSRDEDSTLYQINRMSPEELQQNAEENTQ